MTHKLSTKPSTVFIDAAEWLKENHPELLIAAYNDLREWMAEHAFSVKRGKQDGK